MMRDNVLNYKRLNDDAFVPTRGTANSAGLDLYACTPDRDIFIPSGRNHKVGTGIAVEIPEGYFGAVFARSGMATKEGLRPANCVGVIDSDYRGEVIVALYNDSKSDEKAKIVRHGDRIAQLVLIPYVSTELHEVTELTDTVRGAGGFGSTGVTTQILADA